MSNLMDGCGNRLDLAHTLPDGDALVVRRKIAVHIGGHWFKFDGDEGRAFQRLHKDLIVLDVPGQRGSQLRQGLAIRLAHIEHLDRAEHGNLDFLFFHDRLAVRIQDWSMGVRVALHFLDLLFVGGRGDDGNAMLALFHMTLKLVLPFIESGDQCGVRLLHIDEHCVVDGVAVEPGHDG